MSRPTSPRSFAGLLPLALLALAQEPQQEEPVTDPNAVETRGDETGDGEGSGAGDFAELLLADSGPPTLELSLDEALRIALENNLDLEIAEHVSEIARLNWRGSWGAFDPVFSLDLTRLESDDVQQQEQFGLDENQNPVTLVQVGQTFTNETNTYGAGLALPFETGGEAELSFGRDDLIFDSANPFAPEQFQADILTLSLSQPLLRGAGSRFATAAQRTAEIDFLIEQERKRLTRQQLQRDVHNAYWDLVAAIDQLDVRELALRLGQEQLEQNRRRLEVGVGTEVDVLQAEADVATREEERLRADVDVLAAIDGLHMLLFGSDQAQDRVSAYDQAWSVEIRPITPLPAVDYGGQVDWMASLALALERRPDLQEQIQRIERSRVDLQRAHADRAPQLDLNLSFASRGIDSDPSSPSEFSVLDFESLRTAATLNFSTPLGNRTRAYAERAARAQVIRSRLDYRRTELNVASEVRAATRDVTFQAQATAAAAKTVELATRQLQAEEARYAEGLSTTFQVLEFQRDLAQALSSEKAARVAYAKALVALQTAEGRIGEDL